MGIGLHDPTFEEAYFILEGEVQATLDGTALRDARFEVTGRGLALRYPAGMRSRLEMDLALTGWVSNEPDGSVRCVAEGPRAALETLLASLEEGPTGALVDRVSSHWEMATGHWATFEVRSGSHRGD